jgi:hypothetical protein
LGGYLLARQLDLHYRFDALMCGAGILGTVLLVVTSGWLATRTVLNQSPRAVLD